MVVEARLAVRQKLICMGTSMLGTRRCPLYGVRRHPLLGGFSIMGSSIGGSGTVRSRGGVRSREGPLSEVSLYI